MSSESRQPADEPTSQLPRVHREAIGQRVRERRYLTEARESVQRQRGCFRCEVCGRWHPLEEKRQRERVVTEDCCAGCLKSDLDSG